MFDHQPTQVELPVPVGIAVAMAGATVVARGIVRYQPPPIELKSAELTLAGHSLGMWVLDAFEAHSPGYGRLATYRATLRQVEEPPDPEPVDDAFATWIKAKRDEYADGSGHPVHPQRWDTLDSLLDQYREHRATGTPLDQPLSED